MAWDSEEVREILRMIEAEHLDVRAVTMGISLRDTAAESLERTCARVYEKLMRSASALVSTAQAVEADYGVPITNKRICVTPMALVTEPTRATRVVEAAVDARPRRRRAGHRLHRRLLGAGREGR